MSKTSVAVRRESPIYHIDIKTKGEPKGGVSFEELAYFGHLTLRGASNDPAFVKGVKEVLGLTLPTTPLTSTSNDKDSIHWISPNEWLILLEENEPTKREAGIEAALKAKLTGHFSVIDVSGGQTLFKLSGDNALLLMQKSCGYDVVGELPMGKTVTTHFAKASVVLHKPSEDTFILVVRRSFADYVWRWIEDASQEYGLITL